MPKPTFLDLPDIVMSNIFEHLDFRPIMTLRKVCRSLRDFIDDVKPDGRFRLLRIFYYFIDKGLHLKYKIGMEEEKEVVYKQSDNENYQELFHSDMKQIFRFQKQKLEKLVIRLNFPSDRQFSVQELFENQLQVNYLVIDVQPHLILPYFKPETLETIMIMNEPGNTATMRMDQIVELPQWIHCKNVSIDRTILSPKIENFLHLTHANLLFESIAAKDLVAIKKHFLQSPIPMKLMIESHNFPMEQRVALNETFGDPVILERGPKMRWYFRIPDTVSDVLFVSCYSDAWLETVCFERIDRSGIPEDVEIH